MAKTARKTNETKRNEYTAELIKQGFTQAQAEKAALIAFPPKAEKGAIVARSISEINRGAIVAAESSIHEGIDITNLAVVKKGHAVVVSELLKGGREAAQAVVLGYALERKAVATVKNIVSQMVASGAFSDPLLIANEFKQFDGLRRFATDSKRLASRFIEVATAHGAAVAMHMLRRPEINFRTTKAQFENRLKRSIEDVQHQALNTVH